MNPTILVVGMGAGGAESLTASLLARIHAAVLLVGGRRHLGYFPDFRGETLAIAADMDVIGQRLQRALAQGEQAVVLASGDPLCYGIGTTLLRYVSAEALEIIPSPTAFQLAFAALHEPWHDAIFLSAHARPLDAVVQQVLHSCKAAILTDNQHTPPVIAQALLQAGVQPESRCAICENLGGPEKRIVRMTLVETAQQHFAKLNVFVVWPHSRPMAEQTPGLPDDDFATNAAQITKREIRLLAMAELGVQPGHVVWDIGAGSGSVSIEIARQVPTAQIYAVEKRAEFQTYLTQNVKRFGTHSVQIVQGTAPAACIDWPRPHAVFIGGSGGQMAELIDFVVQQLHPSGRLVINLATLENLDTVRQFLPDATINQVQISRGVPIGEMLRLQALNPVFMVRWVKGKS